MLTCFRWRLIYFDDAPRTEQSYYAKYLGPGVAAPALEVIKDFLRFYAKTSHPMLFDAITVESLNTVAEWFFAGFLRLTGTEVVEADRKEVYEVSLESDDAQRTMTDQLSGCGSPCS